jgi:hypothetical protein
MEEIQFNEQEHRYYDGSKIEYTSVTTLIGKYTNTYDTDFWAMYTALKEHNYKVKPEPEKQSIWCRNVLYKLKDLYKDDLFILWAEEVKARWKVLTGEACFRGNAIHNELENSIDTSKQDYTKETNLYISKGGDRSLKTQHDLDKTNLQEKYPIVHTRLSGYIERGFSIYAEKRVHLPEFGIAGMIDVPLIHGKHFAILDWKTNKAEMHNTAGYFKKVNIGGKWVKSDIWVETGERFKYPLDMLPASKLHTYALQLSTYSRILEYWGYIPMNNHLELIHFSLNGEPKLIKLPYLRDEVDMMLYHHKENNLIIR